MMVGLPGVLSQGGVKFIWERYSVVYEEVEHNGYGNTDNGIEKTSTIYHSTSRSFDSSTGKYKLTVKKRTCDSMYVGFVFYDNDDSINNSFTTGEYDEVWKNTIKQIFELEHSPDSLGVIIGRQKYTSSANKGSLIDTIESPDPAAYPQNGIQDGYWYVLVS